jgi:hypothetical protein
MTVRPEMRGKSLYFVVGHPRPAVAPDNAPFIRKHPDGSPMRAISGQDTLAACEARFAKGDHKRQSGPLPAAPVEHGEDGQELSETGARMPTRGKRG